MIHLQSSSETRRGWQRSPSSKKSEARSDCFELCISTRYALRFTSWDRYLMDRIDHWPLVDIQSSTKSKKSDERGALHHKSVNTEFDCRGPFQRKRTQSLTETRHIAHECSHDNPFYRDIWKKRWSRKNLIRLCEEKCKYLLLFKEMTTSRWLVQARVFFTFEIKGFAWQNETLKKWTKILSFFSHWTEYLFSWDIWCNVCYP